MCGVQAAEDNFCVARAQSERGELFLFRRGDGALELRVNGVFVMDTAHTTTERLLAAETLNSRLARAVPAEGARVLIGGLGLGFTLQEVLANHRVTRAHVVEIEPAVVAWHREGLIPDSVAAFRDERVEVSVGDVADVLAGLPASSLDVILLDVDNGPDFLVYERNAAVYQRDFLAVCDEKLSPDGIAGIWSADASPQLASAMRAVFPLFEEVAVPVVLGNRNTTYHLFIAQRRT